ncbi:MAG: GntR family transcriptional regulator, transcriptional repressor for pyruvate dehydrogenase complex [bacterium]
MSAHPDREGAGVRRSVSERVADSIRVWMQSEGLRPGDRLGREEDLARRFEVSRPTLREALRLLSSAHLVRASKGPGGGIFVEATPEEGIGRAVSDSVASMLQAQSITIEELLETRMLLEVPLVGLAAQRATEADVARLNDVLADAERRPYDGEHVGMVDARLHQLIAEIAGNRLAAAFNAWVVEVLGPPLRELVAPAVVESVIVEQNRDIVRAIERGDPAAAERAMREHLVYVRDLVAAVAASGLRDR